MKTLHSVHPEDFKGYSTDKIRDRFLMSLLFEEDHAHFAYVVQDRLIAGLISPVSKKLELENKPMLKAEFFLERREAGFINIGGRGKIKADNQSFELERLDCVYIGKGTKTVEFVSENKEDPALFYMLSSTAHAEFPSTRMTHTEAIQVAAGESSTSNLRTIHKYIHADGIKSCQLVMGLTRLNAGSVWNTMPAHVHDRRTEIYFYFDLPESQRVVHYMGEGHETRHLFMSNLEAVFSPPWSIHAGSGTFSYSFIWGMAGENQDYSDMDPVSIANLN